MFRLTLFITISLAVGTVRGQTVLYVDDTATGANNGSSWCDAYVYLQDALAAAEASGGSVNEIRLAQGAYKPDQGASQTPGDREATFQLLNGIALRGGYAGCGEADPNERDIEAHETVVSGDLDGNDSAGDTITSDCCTEHEQYGGCDDATCEDLVCAYSSGCCDHWTDWCVDWLVRMLCCDLCTPSVCDNSYHVMTGSGGTVFVDGVTISGGNAVSDGSGSGPQYTHGGGVVLPGTGALFANCSFQNNYAHNCGGAIGHWGGQSTLSLSHCLFLNNMSGDYGGGIYAYNDLSLDNCIFDRNTAREGAGAILHFSGNFTITNCRFTANETGYVWGAVEAVGGGYVTIANTVFSGNHAPLVGGALYLLNADTLLVNSTFTGNDSGRGKALVFECSDPQNDPCTLQVRNCILWDGGDEVWTDDSPITFAYSDIQGGWPGEGNIDADPLFIDPDNGDYHVDVCSPVVNAGDPSYTPDPGETDIDGDDRVIGSAIDMGADEVTDPCLEGIPTVSEWGLVAMTLLVLAVGTVVLRRRHAAQM